MAFRRHVEIIVARKVARSLALLLQLKHGRLLSVVLATFDDHGARMFQVLTVSRPQLSNGHLVNHYRLDLTLGLIAACVFVLVVYRLPV